MSLPSAHPEGTTTGITLTPLSSANLGVQKVDLRTVDSAKLGIYYSDEALKTLSAAQSILGAQMRIVESYAANDSQLAMNLHQASSTAVDANIASDAASLKREQLQQRINFDLLSQAHISTAAVLGLFHGP